MPKYMSGESRLRKAAGSTKKLKNCCLNKIECILYTILVDINSGMDARLSGVAVINHKGVLQ